MDSILRKNSLLIVLYLYMYGLLVPINLLVGGEYPIIVFTLLLFAYSLTINKIKLNLGTLILILFPLVLLLLKLPFEPPTPSGFKVAEDMLISFLSIGLSGILLGSFDFSHRSFFVYGYKIGVLNFFMLCLLPLLPIYNEELGYMKFGYSMLPTVIFSLYYFFRIKRGLVSLIILTLSFIELFAFGARGAMLTFVLFCVVYFFFASNLTAKFKVVITMLALVGTLSIYPILKFLSEKTSEMGYYSYPLAKYLMLFEGKSLAEASSGRDFIYESAMNRINESYLLGSPLNTCYIDTGTEYYHNIFLDIIVSFGVIVLFIFIFFIVYKVYKVMKISNRDIRVIFFLLLLIPFGRLSISSIFWKRPEFWVFMSFCLNNFIRYKKINK